MTKFDKFYEFITEYMIYPLGLAFISIIAAVVACGIMQTEIMWMFITAAVITVITALWLGVFLVAFTINKVIEWREERQYREEQEYDEAFD